MCYIRSYEENKMRTSFCALVFALVLVGGETCSAQGDLIFEDDFESGDVTAWSNAVGYQPVPVIDLRADVNRNGTVDLNDPSEDFEEDSWDATHGAIFLANIDDDENACPTTGTDPQLAACNDAADDVVNGVDDLLDLARLVVAPWPSAPDDASAAIELSTNGAIPARLFMDSGGTFVHFDPTSDTLTPVDLRSGVEFAIEATDIVRSTSIWDGFLDVTLNVEAGTGPMGPLEDGSDTVRLRVAPVLFRHHIDEIETIYASAFSDPASTVFRIDLADAASQAGVSNPLHEFEGYTDRWTQDFFETTIMSMPAVTGVHTIHLNFRSANYTGGDLRTAGRLVFTELRGPDVAGAVQYDPLHDDGMDTLNSFGNTETIPPYEHDRATWPLGRVVRGGTPTFYPDASFDELIDAQGMQPVVHIDTSWLLVAHIDETITFLPATSPRGWVVLAADVTTAWNELVAAQGAGYGNTPMFVGKPDPWGGSAERTINQVLNDSDIASANAWAAVEVAAQLDQLAAETGITQTEILSAPFLLFEYWDYLVAMVPGVVNGIVLPNGVFAAPDPHGPNINGVDLFKVLLEQSLNPVDFNPEWVEDWEFYHIHMGEVHCGANATHEIPIQPWWEAMP